VKLSPHLACALVWLTCLATPVSGQDQGATAADRQSASAPPSNSAPAAPHDRKTIGLALGGGSARGFAHIGVLDWFEKHRIPIDYIAGTSMGGLVAGTYASGMSPGEVRDLMQEVDWDLMFLADSPYEYKTFRRKQDRRSYPSLVEFGLNGGFRLPSGLNPGQQVALLLDHIALPYAGLESFDDLPTPYRCVATDLKKAQAVVLGRGALSQAMRATMAIPGVFTPVHIENWLLVDGGAVNNVPANVVREMGSDVVISVDVGADTITDNNEEEARASLVALMGRTIEAMMTGSIREALKNSDIVIDPDLRGLESMDWRKSGDLAERGYQAAEALGSKLLQYQLSEADYAAFMAARNAKRKRGAPAPEAIAVVGGTARDEAFIRQQLAGHMGKPFDERAFVNDLLAITGTDRYEYLTYGIAGVAGRPRLLIGVRPKGYGPPFLNLSVELTNVDSSSFAFNVGGRVTSYDITTPGSELRMEFGLGTRQLIGAELYQPFGAKGLFVAPRGYFSRTGRNAYIDEEFVAEYRAKRTGAGIDLGWSTGRRAELRFGADIADVRGRRRIGIPDLPELSGTEKSARLQFIFDGQDSPTVPSRGVYARSVLRRFLSTPEVTHADGIQGLNTTETFWQGESSGSYFHPRSKDDRFFLLAGGGTSFKQDPVFNNFSLGGPFRLGAFNNDELRASNYVLGTVGYLHRFGRLPDVLGANIFGGGWLENGSAFDDWADAKWRSNVSAGAIIESLIGPVFVGGSLAFDGRSRIYIAIGTLFR